MYHAILHSLITAVSLMVVVEAAPQRPKALVYRGPAACDGCPESVANLLESSPYNFQVAFAGPKEKLDVTEQTLRNVSVYAFPGGPDLETAYRKTKQHKRPIQGFVAAGGHYLGFCLGTYLAGPDSGYDLLPKGTRVASEINQPDSQVRNSGDTVIQVDWTFSNGRTEKRKWLYFQEGAYITDFDQQDGRVIAHYSQSGDIAASVTKYGRGTVGLVGPHPEADQSWYEDAGFTNSDGVSFKYGYDLISAMLS